MRLRQPHGSSNPHGFDFELWLFEQRHPRQRYGARRRRRARGCWPRAPATRSNALRQAMRDAIAAARAATARAAGVLAALAVGDQAAIERDDWDLFRHTGVAHLMSISGLHVTMFAWLAALIVGALWRLQRPR